MQKRFCSCGHMIMVRYHRRHGVWMPQVLEANKVKGKRELPECPACGNPLTIHFLR